MSGFRRTGGQTRSGRKVTHTPKVQDILSRSICEAYDAMCDELKEQEINLRTSMANRKTVPEVKVEYEVWLDSRQRMQQLYVELNSYVKDDVRKQYHQKMTRLQPQITQLMEDIDEYCEDGPLLSPEAARRIRGVTGLTPPKPDVRPREENPTSKGETDLNLPPPLDTSRESKRVPKIEVHTTEPHYSAGTKETVREPAMTQFQPNQGEKNVGRRKSTNPRKIVRVETRKQQYTDLRQRSLDLEREIQGIEQELERSVRQLNDKTRLRLGQGDTRLPDFRPPRTHEVKSEPRYEERRYDVKPSVKPPPVDRDWDDEPGTSTPLPRPLRENTLADRDAAMISALKEISQSANARYRSERLPKIEPKVFGGEPLEFTSWWSSFQTLIESAAETQSDRLFYLFQYTKGPVQACVAPYLSKAEEEGSYDKAKRAVLSRFGDRTRIAAAYKRRINDWPVIPEFDGPALQAFSDYLNQCNTAITSLNYLGNLNSQEENLKIVAKLPRVVKQKWLRIVDRMMYGDDSETEFAIPRLERHPTFDRFCRFLTTEARIVNSMGFSVEDSSQKGGRSKHQVLVTDSKEQSHTAKQNSERSVPQREGLARNHSGPRKQEVRDKPDDTKTCTFCRESHHISTCVKFLSNNSEFKKVYARARGLCYGCLSNKHLYPDCQERNKSLLSSPSRKPQAPIVPATALSTKITSLKVHTNDQVLYNMVVPVRVCLPENAGREIIVYALLDSQSDGHFISENLRRKLQAPFTDVSLELTHMGQTEIVRSKRIDSVCVRGLDITEAVYVREVYTRDIPGDVSRVPDPEVVATFDHLKEVAREMPPILKGVQVEMLIGFTCFAATKPLETVHSPKSNMYAIRTPLGWTVTGRPGKPGDTMNPSILCFRTKVRPVTCEEIKTVFNSGFEGNEQDSVQMSADDLKFLRIMKEGVKVIDGRIQLPLPLKYEPKNLPDSRPKALGSTKSLLKKMRKNPDCERKYCGFFGEMIEAKQMRRVHNPEATPIGECWYWCIHFVDHPKKPDKVRGVFNGASEVQGFCINDLLLQGPDMNNSLIGVLCRYRKEKRPVQCDIKNMFHQVLVDPKFWSLLRVFWFEDNDINKPIVEYCIVVHLFGATSSPACANFALKETAHMFGKKYSPEAEKFVRTNFYVDDGLGSQPDNDSAARLIEDSRSLCKEGGFDLHKFASDEPEVLKEVPQELIAKTLQKRLTKEELPVEKALGVDISLARDSFEYHASLPEKPSTRRGCLSALSGVYDPLGFVSPCILPGRRLLQEMCQEKLAWDEKLADKMTKKWSSWYGGLEELNKISVKRCIRRKTELPLKKVNIHVFCDASMDGQGAAGYVRLEDHKGNKDTSLMIAKSKVPPTRTVTVPRRELQAAVTAVKLGNFLKEELDYKNIVVHYHTDSMIVMGYITNEGKRYTIYVTNRASYIRENSVGAYWHHVPTELNPADIASRGVAPEELVNNKLWWEGPEEYLDSITEEQIKVDLDPNDPELKKEVVVLNIQVTKNMGSNLKRFSTWSRAIRALAAALKFGDIWRHRDVRSRAVYLAQAAESMIRIAQSEHYEEDLKLMKKGDRNIRNSCLRGLDPWIDEGGILRVNGRLVEDDVPIEYSSPVVVPHKHWSAYLLIQKEHQQLNHAGPSTTWYRLRQMGFWITNGRSTIGNILAKCITCIRLRGRFQTQVMAPLPKCRVQEALPFEHSGVDLFGPYYVKTGRVERKRWCCIFACMVIRAVHIEIVHSLDTSSYILAYRRFTNRRGPVKKLYSDRGTNFIGGANEIQRESMKVDFDQLSTELAAYGCDVIDHEFNSPQSSHMGGSWERMIRTTRSSLDHVIIPIASRLTDEMLKTVVSEAEAIVNSRPISHVEACDPKEHMALTPNMILTLRPQIVYPLPGDFSDSDMSERKIWRLVQATADKFWKRWRAEVLPELMARQKWDKPMKNLQVGDLVVVYEEQTPRPMWPLGMVVETRRGRDGRVRRVHVKVRDKIVERPIHKLIKLFHTKFLD